MNHGFKRARFSRRAFVGVAAMMPLVGCARRSPNRRHETLAEDFGSIQEAIDHAIPGTTVLIPAGTFYESIDLRDTELSIRGAGAAATILSGDKGRATISVSRDRTSRNIQISNMTVTSQAGGGHLIDVPYGLALSSIIDLRLVQIDPSSAAFHYHSSGQRGGIFDCRVAQVYLKMPSASTIPGVYIHGARNVASGNVFRNIRAEGGGSYLFHLESSSQSYCYNNQFSDITFERCENGGIRILGGMNNIVNLVGVYDTASVRSDVVYIGRSLDGPLSRGNSVTNYMRSSGQLIGSAVDVRMPASENSSYGMIGSLTGVPSVDLRLVLADGT